MLSFVVPLVWLRQVKKLLLVDEVYSLVLGLDLGLEVGNFGLVVANLLLAAELLLEIDESLLFLHHYLIEGQT